MPTKREREYYRMGFLDGQRASRPLMNLGRDIQDDPEFGPQGGRLTYTDITKKPKRKLSAWNKFVKANSKKKIFRFANGKLKLKKMGIAFRKTRAGRKR
jgi:hypothetical protein